MKIKIIFLLIIFVLVKLVSYEAVLIDFSNLDRTSVDFSYYVKGYMWPEDKKKEMILNLSPKNWRIKINPSSWTYRARDKTYVLPITNSINYPNQTVLGIRVFFPERLANSYAEIFPPFSIPSYYDNPDEPDGMGSMFLHKGIVRNVGILRKLSVRFLGNNFTYSLYVRVEDKLGGQRDIFVGYMNFVGWKTKSWVNPNIDFELKLKEIRKNQRPYYPDEYPYLKFICFVVHRAEPQVTGNFITMIKEVTIEYDEAFLEVAKAEYLQEDIFGIWKEEMIERAKNEMKSVDRRIYLEWVENMKMDKSEEKLNKDSSKEAVNGE